MTKPASNAPQGASTPAKLEGNKLPQNPYGGGTSEAANVAKDKNAVTSTEAQRAMIEVMTSFEVAKRFPRDNVKACDLILKECSRPSLAEVAVYQFAKGGQSISGATIRLMEAISRHWTNIQFGWRCLERRGGSSSIQAYARDLETNTFRDIIFDVKHWRDTKSGGYAIKDEREIYELEANFAMRRVRACLQGLIPGDVIDMALDACEVTMTNNADCSPEGVKKLLDAFEKFGVNKAMIEARIQCKTDAIKPQQITGLRKVYASLKDGMGVLQDFFDTALADKKTESTTSGSDLSKAAEANKQPEKKSESVDPKTGEVTESDDDTFPGDKPMKK